LRFVGHPAIARLSLSVTILSVVPGERLLNGAEAGWRSGSVT
jgi:hypothetical protein